MKFTIYDPMTGRVLQGGTADDPYAFLQEGQAIYEGEEYYAGWIADGIHFEQPAQPSPHHVFDWVAKVWIDPRTPQDHIAATRARRDALLAPCDWTQLPDVPLATKQAWAGYRQALRDITNQPDQMAINWPLSP